MIAALTSISLLLLAAHALRPGDWALAAVFLLLCGAVFSRRAWLRPVLALVLALGCVVWAESGAEFLRLRLALGQPWLRLALILGGVLALTALSSALLLTPRARAWFCKVSDQDAARAWAFALTAGLLILARQLSPVPVLLADRFVPGSGVLEILGLAWYASWACGLLVAARDTARLRLRLWLLFSLVFFGQLGLGLVLDGRFLMTGRLHLPVPALIAAGPYDYRGEHRCRRTGGGRAARPSDREGAGLGGRAAHCGGTQQRRPLARRSDAASDAGLCRRPLRK